MLRAIAASLLLAAVAVPSGVAGAGVAPAQGPAPLTEEGGVSSDVPAAAGGVEAVVALLADGGLDAAAATADWSGGELASALLTDPSVFVTDDGVVGHIDPAPAPHEPEPVPVAALAADASTVMRLHSRPDAPLTVLLDIDGHTTTETYFNQQHDVDVIESRPFDRDGDPSSLSSREAAEIHAVWTLVAEDYAPFDVDVTTEDPGIAGLRRDHSGDGAYGIRVVISPTDAWVGGSYGGVAYVGSFGWLPSRWGPSNRADTPAFVFSDNLYSFKSVGDASSHEAGHSLSLRHDGTNTQAYYRGHAGWGPIMGSTYRQPLAQWSRGTYAGADNHEDDLAALTTRLGRRADDHGNTAATATPIGATASVNGFVGAADTVDAFTVHTGAGQLSVQVTAADTVSSNLFASVTIRDTSGAIVASGTPPEISSKPSAGGTAPLDWVAQASASVPGGRYTVEVRPAGLDEGAPDGFEAYGSHGGFRLTVSAPAPTTNVANDSTNIAPTTTTTTTTPPPPEPPPPDRPVTDARPAPEPARVTAVDPVRLADTRGAGRVPAGGVLHVAVGGGGDVPVGASAAAVNITAVGPQGPGYLTAYPCSVDLPDTSTVNFAAGRDIANATIASLSDSGELCVYASTPTDVIVDLTGWIAADADAAMSPAATLRVTDTRSGLGGSGRVPAGGTITVPVARPDATAVALNVTAVGADHAGYLTAFPCGAPVPSSSTVNFGPGEARPNNAIVAVGRGGNVCVLASASVDVLVDVTAVFRTDGRYEYVPAAPRRLLDTRASGRVSDGGSVSFAVPGPTGSVPAAASVNVTATGHDRDGYATAYDCGPLPDASTLNQRAGESNANGAIVAVTAGSSCVFTSSTTHVIVDLTGWWLPT